MILPFLVGESITDGFLLDANKIPTITPGTGNVTLTAKKLGALTVFSRRYQRTRSSRSFRSCETSSETRSRIRLSAPSSTVT